jgi:hypothetical protein
VALEVGVTESMVRGAEKMLVDGVGTSAILIRPVWSLTGSNNKCEGNHLNSSKPSLTQVILDKDSKNNVMDALSLWKVVV